MHLHRFLPAKIKQAIHRSVAALGYQIQKTPASSPGFLRRIPRRSTKEDALIRKAKAHLIESEMPSDLPSFGERWETYASRLRSRIKKVRTTEDLLFLGQSPISGVESHPPELFGYCQYFDLSLVSELPSDLYEAMQSFRSPRIIQPEYTIEYRGRKIDFVTLCAAYDILTILNWLGQARPRTVCDIGGGTGKYALSWLTNSAHRPDLVVILDIPETLVYSETLLRSELGDSRVQYISSHNIVPSTSGVVLCPIAYARAVEGVPFDLVTNKWSMQEMSDEWIDWYMDWLDRQPCCFFWSSNYFGMPLNYMTEGHNSWSPRPSERWQLTDFKLDLSLRNWASLLFRRDSDQDSRPPASEFKGIEGWLHLLDLARRQHDEPSLRRALGYARSQLPFVPKEAWQVAKILSQLTASPEDQALFQELDLIRKSGREALVHSS